MKLFKYLLVFNLAFALVVGRAAEVSAAAKAANNETESNIAQLISKLLERSHYSQREFNDEVSSKFLDRYIDALDQQHLHLFQSDLAEFEVYRTKLDDLTSKMGDTKPAHLIFARMMERVAQRISYVNELLKTEKFEFTGNDRYTPNRHELPRPKNLEEAHQLWRQHLRFEFLQEKLSPADTNKVRTAKLKSTDSIPKITTAKSTNTLTETEKIIQKIRKPYANLERALKDLSDDEVFEIYMTALAHVYDPHSDYMGHSQKENFDISMRLSLFGIGALLESDEGYCKIKELMVGPAMKSKKIKPGDRIVAVAQKDKDAMDVVGMRLNKVVEQIRGPKGTEVRLTIWPADAADSSERREVTLIRDVIKLEDQEAKAKVIELTDKKGASNRIGVIDLPSFYAEMGRPKSGAERKSTTVDVAKLLKKLNQEKIDGIILDLRRNGGGSLEEAINLTGLFITNGPVVQTKDPGGDISIDSDTDKTIAYKGPLIVLTSRFSASASEILAGALQDYERALIVGDNSTYGKGTVQSLQDLEPFMEQAKMSRSYDPGALKLTIRKFYRAGGSSTQLRGVIPDLKLPSVINYAEVGEASMEYPLPWDVVSSATFQRWNSVKPFLADLRKRSDRRLVSDKEYAYIREDIELFKKVLADKSVSMNEETRRKEKKETEERAEFRKKERKSRKKSDQKIFEVTLKNAEQPGLQIYVPKTNELAAVEHPADDADAEEALEDKVPVVDAPLEESKSILLDYISLMARRNPTVSKAE